jgi:hypothetical protein
MRRHRQSLPEHANFPATKLVQRKNREQIKIASKSKSRANQIVADDPNDASPAKKVL